MSSAPGDFRAPTSSSEKDAWDTGRGIILGIFAGAGEGSSGTSLKIPSSSSGIRSDSCPMDFDKLAFAMSGVEEKLTRDL